MTQTKPPRRSKLVPATAEPTPVATHQKALGYFQTVIEILEARGWRRHRVDTLRHMTSDPADREAETIRHHYDHDVWELYLEPDKYWNPAARPIRTVYIRRSDLRDPAHYVEELLGI